MAENSAIEWTDHTFNPWEGCQKVSPACDNCYAETRQKRWNGGEAPNWGPGAPRRKTSAANWRQPIKWNRDAEADKRRKRVFCASLADVFDNAVDPEWRRELFELIAATPWLDWLLLTKRIGNVPAMIAELGIAQLPDNVWLGISVVTQAEAERDVPKLLSIPAAVRFLSVEPMLESVNIRPFLHSVDGIAVDPLCDECDDRHEGACEDAAIDWIICGGESGPGARPMHPDWARGLRDQCVEADVPFLFKQWGEWLPAGQADRPGLDYTKAECHRWGDGHKSYRIGKKWAGRKLDRMTFSEFPEPRHAAT